MVGQASMLLRASPQIVVENTYHGSYGLGSADFDEQDDPLFLVRRLMCLNVFEAPG